jgi:hypothetical protein
MVSSHQCQTAENSKKSVAAGAAKVEAISFDPHRRVHVVESKLEHTGLDSHACSLKAITRGLQKFSRGEGRAIFAPDAFFIYASLSLQHLSLASLKYNYKPKEMRTLKLQLDRLLVSV